MDGLKSIVRDTDITGELPQLKGAGWKVMGTSQKDTRTTLTDSELSAYPDDYFVGGTLYSIDHDELKEITDFRSKDGVVTFESLTHTIPNIKYILTRSFSEQILKTFKKLEDVMNLLMVGDNISIDPYDLKEVHVYLAIAEVCKGLSTDDSGFWYKMWKEYETRGSELLLQYIAEKTPIR